MPDWSGHAQPDTGTMGVRCDETTPAWVAETAAHEVRHLHAPGRGEADAQGYGQWVAEVLYGRSEPAKAVHAHSGYPYAGVTLAGLANHGDVLVASHDGTKTVWRNDGQSSPAWVKHYRGCPVV